MASGAVSGKNGTSGGATGGVAEGGESSSTQGGSSSTGGPIPEDNGPQAKVRKVDLLLAVDNSLSMAETQKLFAKALPELVERLVNPSCVNAAGNVVAEPTSPEAACPDGSKREFAPLRDLHIGVITSSLGSHGSTGPSDVCVDASANDQAHLLPRLRSSAPSYDNRGFLKWDPDARANPPGESDPKALADALGQVLADVGEDGCGLEAQLESVYRFLVDPAPPATVTLAPGSTLATKVGVDEELLAERAAFLRPDSSVVVLMLTDENDCSVLDEGYGWLVTRYSANMAMFRSTSQCQANPNDPCCQSCGEAMAHEGCPPLDSDAECQMGRTLPTEDDNLNLRCFAQKRRFGMDLLYPTSRYVSGFGGGNVPDRNGDLVANPLFHNGSTTRDPSLFTLALIGGMPWQDVATSDSITGTTLELLTPAELESEGRWELLIGDAATNTPPSDPFMRESVEPRDGENPLTHDAIVPSSSTDPKANAINGHEYLTLGYDLQYACTFDLPQPRECDAAAEELGASCACFADGLDSNRPVCNPPAGGAATTTQYQGKAYPAARELSVARALGRRTVLGSVCSRNTQDEARSDYGYRPVFAAIGRRIADTLVKP